MIERKVSVEFVEELLGTSSSNPDLHSQFIASKSSDAEKAAEELAALSAEELEEQSRTVFPRENGVPFLWDYQIKGFFKDAALSLMESDGSCISKIEDQKKLKMTAFTYKRTIDNQLFIAPRKVLLVLPEGGAVGSCQRPLRAQTMRGERIALAHSETVPAGTRCVFTVSLMHTRLEEFVEEALKFGRFKGLGQWRNSGKGRFEVKVS